METYFTFPLIIIFASMRQLCGGPTASAHANIKVFACHQNVIQPQHCGALARTHTHAFNIQNIILRIELHWAVRSPVLGTVRACVRACWRACRLACACVRVCVRAICGRRMHTPDRRQSGRIGSCWWWVAIRRLASESNLMAIHCSPWGRPDAAAECARRYTGSGVCVLICVWCVCFFCVLCCLLRNDKCIISNKLLDNLVKFFAQAVPIWRS